MPEQNQMENQSVQLQKSKKLNITGILLFITGMIASIFTRSDNVLRLKCANPKLFQNCVELHQYPEFFHYVPLIIFLVGLTLSITSIIRAEKRFYSYSGFILNMVATIPFLIDLMARLFKF